MFIIFPDEYYILQMKELQKEIKTLQKEITRLKNER